MPHTKSNGKRLSLIAVFATAAALVALSGPVAAEHAEDDPCMPENVRLTVTQDGILIEWDEIEDVLSYDIERSGGGENMSFNVDDNQTSFLDTEVEAGVTYTYVVRAFIDQAPSLPGGTTLTEACGEHSATAIPVFPSIVAGALALVGAVVAYVGSRRL